MRRARALAIFVVIAIAAAIAARAQFFNTGFHWSNFGPFGVPARLSAIAADPRSPTTFLLAAPGGGLWRSADGGGSFTVLTDTAPVSQICAMALDPANPDNIFLGTGDDQSLRPNPGVLHSPDGGVTWLFSAGFSTNAICTLAVDPANSTHVIAGSLNGIFRSVDSGVTWTVVSTVATQSVVFDPAGTGVVYAANYQPTFLTGFGSQVTPLMKSLDGGITWTQLSFSPPDSTDFRVFKRATVVLGEPGTIYFANSYSLTPTVGYVDVYTSTDGGNTWNVVSRAAPFTGTSHMPMIYDTVNKYLYLGANTLVRATAAAQAFATVKYPSVGNIEALSFNVLSTPPALLVAGDYGVVNVPLDSTAATALNNPPVGIFQSLSLDPVTSGGIYASGESGLQIYAPFFGTWKRAVSSAVGYTLSISGNPQNVWAMGNAAFNRSVNGGTAFTTITAINAAEPRAPYPPLLTSNVGGVTVLYTAGQRFYRSTDSGATWNAVGTSTIDTAGGVITAIAASVQATNVIYAAASCLPATYVVTPACPAQSRIYMSTTTGATWTRLAAVNGFVSRLAVDPIVPTAVYAAIGAFPGGPNPAAGLITGDLLVIRNLGGTQGVTTTSLKANLPDAPINAIALGAPGGGIIIGGTLTQTYYVGTDKGVFGTSNGGTSWVSLSSGLPNVPVTDLQLQAGTTLRAATYGRGLYQSTLPTGALTPTITPLGSTIAVRQGQSATLPFTVTNTSTAAIAYSIQLNDAFLSVSNASGTLAANASEVVLLTINAATLNPGSYRTAFQIVRAANATFTTPFSQDFNLSINVGTAPATLAVVSGNGVSASAGSQVTLAASTADAAGIPLSGVAVAFRITSGGGSLSTGSALTNTLGVASTTLTLPATAGPVNVAATVAAAAGTLTASFTVTSVVVPTPTLNSGAAVNAASFVPGGSLAPGTIFSLFGTQLAPAVFTAQSIPLPAILGGTQVLLGATPVPLFVVSPTQINAMIPFEATLGPAQITVQIPSPGGGSVTASNAIQTIITSAAPGLFTLTSNGSGAGVFVKSDATIVSAKNPAKRGTMVTFYATGLGAVTPSVASGAAAQGAPHLSVAVTVPVVNIGGVDSVVQFAGLAPGFAGLYQINALIPAAVAPETNVPVTLRVGTALSNTVTIAVN